MGACLFKKLTSLFLILAFFFLTSCYAERKTFIKGLTPEFLLLKLEWLLKNEISESQIVVNHHLNKIRLYSYQELKDYPRVINIQLFEAENGTIVNANALGDDYIKLENLYYFLGDHIGMKKRIKTSTFLEYPPSPDNYFY
jgi:hypothetical protein